MQDRIPRYPGRVKITHADGTTEIVTITRDDDPEREGTPLNKGTLLQDPTAALYGLGVDAVPDDVLAMVGQLKEHWWSVTTHHTGKFTTSVEKDAAPRRIFVGSSVAQNNPIQIGSISKGTGEFIVEREINVTYEYRENANLLKGHFIRAKFPGEDNGLESKPYFVAENAPDATYVYSADDDSIVRLEMATVKTVSNQDPFDEITYVTSTKRNAYPDNGTVDDAVDGAMYRYLGVPFDDAKFAAGHRAQLLQSLYTANDADAVTVDMSEIDWDAWDVVVLAANITNAAAGQCKVILQGGSTAQVGSVLMTRTGYQKEGFGYVFLFPMKNNNRRISTASVSDTIKFYNSAARYRTITGLQCYAASDGSMTIKPGSVFRVLGVQNL